MRAVSAEIMRTPVRQVTLDVDAIPCIESEL